MAKGGFFVFLSCIASITLALLTSCGSSSSYGPPPPVSKTEVLYAAAANVSGTTISTQLSSFQLDAATGVLTLTASTTQGSLFAGLVLDPAAKFLYASDLSVNLPAGSIASFSVTPKTGVPVPASTLALGQLCSFCPIPSAPGILVFAPGAKTLYYASSTPVLGGGVAQGVGALKVGSDGALSVIPGSPFAADLIPFSVAVHPSGKFVYTANIGQITGPAFVVQSISCYAVDPATGALSPAPNSPFPVVAANNGTWQSLVIHPSGKYLYLTTGNSANGILGWSIDPANGSLAALSGSPFASGTIPGGGAFDSTGRFLYTGGTGGSVSVFSADPSTGALTPASSPASVAGTNYSAPAIDPSGKFLFVGDGAHKSIQGFRIDPQTGSLTTVGNPAPVNGVSGLLVIANAP